jgi:hypothetical protein|tara:strand:+ start:99 stop:392 length:294 start_codon:yes stop_codon:yes gene_type:complete
MIDRQVKVGDIVLVMTEYNGSREVKVTSVVDDVSQECGLDPGPGFVGMNDFGEELVYSNSMLEKIVYRRAIEPLQPISRSRGFRMFVDPFGLPETAE